MEKERNARKTNIGTVVSVKNDKTIIVRVDTQRRHPIYGKNVKHSKRLAVHDEQNIAKLNDIVEIMETRPLSKTKHFRLVKIVREAVII